MSKILLIGGSGHAKVIIDCIEKIGTYEIIGLIDRNKNIGDKVLGYSVIGKEEDLPLISRKSGFDSVFIAIGNNFTRFIVHKKVQEIFPEVMYETFIHPFSTIGKECEIGFGTVIMPGSVIGPGCKIGNFCIVNTSCSVDHESSVGDFSSLAPNVNTGGNTEIGSLTAICLGAKIIHGIKVGDSSVVGSCSLVNENVPDKVVCYGIPAKVVRSREDQDNYL